MSLSPRLALLPVFALVACGNGYVRSATCDAPVTELTPDLTAHIEAGPGDGSFAYDPQGAAVASVTGSYNRETGDFTWTELGAVGSWLNNATASGYGYANRNGDLDIVGERTVLDVAGLEQRQQFRIERVGCSVERRIRDFTTAGEREQVETGSYVGDVYTYSRELLSNDTLVETEGQRRVGLDYDESTTVESSEYSYQGETSGNSGDFTSLTEATEFFTTRQGQVSRVSETERFTDGRRVVTRLDTYPSGEQYRWAFELDQGGNGSGTLTVGQTTCDLSYVANQCTFSCPGGQSGSC